MSMKRPYYCPQCHHTYDKASAFLCPYCGTPRACPDPLCILDLENPDVCLKCPKKPDILDAVVIAKPSRGGKRPGAGAPVGNLNRLIHGRKSDLFRHGLNRLISDPDLHYVFIILAQFVLTGDFPDGTKELFYKAVKKIQEQQHA